MNEITQEQIDSATEKFGTVSTIFREALREMENLAFELAKQKNGSGISQLRGAFSRNFRRTEADVREAEGFFSCLAKVVDMQNEN